MEHFSLWLQGTRPYRTAEAWSRSPVWTGTRALLWADSSGAFICNSIMPPEFDGFFTAPHHGSGTRRTTPSGAGCGITPIPPGWLARATTRSVISGGMSSPFIPTGGPLRSAAPTRRLPEQSSGRMAPDIVRAMRALGAVFLDRVAAWPAVCELARVMVPPIRDHLCVTLNVEVRHCLVEAS